MSAFPNRADAVKAIVADHPIFPANDDEKRKLTAVIALRLNQQFGDRWKMLKRLDRGGRISGDIIVWPDTREHFDVLTDHGAMWKNHGIVMDPDWVFIDPASVERLADPVLDGPVDPPPSTPPTPPTPSTLEARVAALEARVNKHLMP